MKNILVKLGGSVITDVSYRQTLIKQLIEIKNNGYNICIVHGGGKLISYYLEKLGIRSEFYEGLRITSDEVLEVVIMVLAGKVNKDIVKEFHQIGARAIGLCGGDGDFIKCKKLVLESGADLGNVGEPVEVNIELYETIKTSGDIMVVATIGIGPEGYYNINADHTAAFVAKELKMDHLIYVSDVDGVLNPQTRERFARLDTEKIDKLRTDGIITTGMLPKLSSCLDALKGGVSRVSIINGKTHNSIYDAVVNQKEPGTEIIL
jgi:acetylglutamate kinase